MVRIEELVRRLVRVAKESFFVLVPNFSVLYRSRLHRHRSLEIGLYLLCEKGVREERNEIEIEIGGVDWRLQLRVGGSLVLEWPIRVLTWYSESIRMSSVQERGGRGREELTQRERD